LDIVWVCLHSPHVLKHPTVTILRGGETFNRMNLVGGIIPLRGINVFLVGMHFCFWGVPLEWFVIKLGQHCVLVSFCMYTAPFHFSMLWPSMGQGSSDIEQMGQLDLGISIYHTVI
jgi:hypothetical protein